MTSPFGKKIRTLVIGVAATAALSIPAVSALGSTAHDAGRHDVRGDSHRLAMGITPASLRLV